MAYNPYSLLRTTEEALRIDEFLDHANDQMLGEKEKSSIRSPLTSPWQGKTTQAHCRQRHHHANRCAGKISPDVRELSVPPRHPKLTEFEQCAVGSEQHNKLQRGHVMMVGQG
jgi:hypothetical protein